MGVEVEGKKVYLVTSTTASIIVWILGFSSGRSAYCNT